MREQYQLLSYSLGWDLVLNFFLLFLLEVFLCNIWSNNLHNSEVVHDNNHSSYWNYHMTQPDDTFFYVLLHHMVWSILDLYCFGIVWVQYYCHVNARNSLKCRPDRMHSGWLKVNFIFSRIRFMSHKLWLSIELNIHGMKRFLSLGTNNGLSSSAVKA